MKIFENIVRYRVMFAIIRMLMGAEWYFSSPELCMQPIHLILKRSACELQMSILSASSVLLVMLDTVRSQCICLDFKRCVCWVFFSPGITREILLGKEQ